MVDTICGKRIIFRIVLWMFPQPEPLHGFSPNFQGMLTPRGSGADWVLGVSCNNCCHGNILDLRMLKFVGVLQPKPLHGFLPNFQDMFTPKGSRAG